MRVEPVQHVMAVLPDGFHHHQRRVRRDLAKHFHAVLLAVDESVLLLGIVGMAAAYFTPFAADGIHDGLFGLRLRGPAFLVGGKTQIPVGESLQCPA